MVAKKSTTMKARKVTKGVVKGKAAKGSHPLSALKKIRVGVCVGKDFDPVKKDTQPPNFPKKLCLTKADWGKYSIDAVTAVKMQTLHPDLMEIDVIGGHDMTPKRLKQNHVNLTFWTEVGTALNSGNKKHIANVKACFADPECRLDPSGDYYDWILNKTRYMTALKKANVPTIPTVMYTNGFNAKKALKDVQKQGWDKFFCKVGSFCFFGFGAINGKTADFLGPRAKELEKYEKENAKSKIFLLQPYMLKPNGEVFDEVRNFFVDGQWRYSVFTHGTDETDAGYYEEPAGPRKEACRAMAEKAYAEALKAATWQGKRQTPLLNRIDIGVIPRKGGDSLHKTDNKYFVNEIEMICTTWLDRYAPCSVADVVAAAGVKHAVELIDGLLKAKKRVPDAANARKVLQIMNERIGPLKNFK